LAPLAAAPLVRWHMAGRAHQTPVAIAPAGRWLAAELLAEELVCGLDGRFSRRYRLVAGSRRWLLVGAPQAGWRLEGGQAPSGRR